MPTTAGCTAFAFAPAQHAVVVQKLLTTMTASSYHLYALPNTTPPKPGLKRVTADGVEIAVEVWEMPISQVGSFLALIPAPLTPPAPSGLLGMCSGAGRWQHCQTVPTCLQPMNWLRFTIHQLCSPHK